ncbi:amidohydrolase family protein [Simiduia aestuariiviva]|uniref:Cytosine/adenosine deaminase-related metal-dependent hydrolase n=1 Tax=Simiduia aestuariiviva TaxID=1510459 RepID=A0A839URJ0_9GAMM|nr:amidohydrolase family protein [Simiduia aestuariiviva]MBB3169331.1 cytosine/adenosine deaminase-related metal-dependent hydrolase [Simiduia aestuariiviva]
MIFNRLMRVFFTLGLSVVVHSAALATDDDYVLFNAQLIDPATRTLTQGGWVQVVAGKIADLGEGEGPRATRRIDLGGAYVMPGLIDAHMHLTAGPLSVAMEAGAPKISMKSQAAVTRFHAQAALASGVTSAFSPAGDPEANHAYREQQRAGTLVGPALTYAGLSFEPMAIEGGTVYPTSVEGWRAELARQKALGVSHIKLYHGLSGDELRQGIAMANEAGLKSIAHLDQVSWQFAVDAGVDVLTHALMPTADLLPEAARADYSASLKPGMTQYLYRWFELVDYDAAPMQQLFASLAKQKVRVDLTLVVNELMYFYPRLGELYPETAWQQHPTIAQSWQRNLGMSLYHWTEEDFVRAQAVFPKVLELLTRLDRAGVPLLLGSDSYSAGSWFWRELVLHQRAGIDPWTILQMVTSRAAHELALGSVGRLEKNYVADLVVMPANPLVDVHAVQGVTQVIQGGQLFDVHQLRTDLEQMATDIQLSQQEQ